jgi:hypothetical protein
MEADMELSVETARAAVERGAHAEAVRILELQQEVLATIELADDARCTSFDLALLSWRL